MNVRRQGYYCIPQYCPNPGRAEAVNVGLEDRDTLFDEIFKELVGVSP